MWLFTRYGFFSVVLARKIQEGIPTQVVDPDTVMVRARCRQHLKNLKQHFKGLTDRDIQESSGTDYRCRMIVPKAVWAGILMEMGGELDYTNFKSACARSALTNQSYEELLHDVWHQHCDLQEQEGDGSDQAEERVS